MRFSSFGAIGGDTPLVGLPRLFAGTGIDVQAKLEFMNPTGSVKDRPARHILLSWLASGRLHPGMRLVESTSGNFGVALAMYCGLYDIRCTLVVDPLVSKMNHALMQHYGADVVQVNEVDDQGGYLHTRLAMVHKIVRHDPEALWVNQYANDLNWESHYYGTGAEILRDVGGPIDYLVVGLSTAGTITGTARRLREEHPDMRVVAVDAAGSMIFGGPPAPRRIPGIGASRRPEILDESLIDEVIYVTDEEAIDGCHQLLSSEGIMAGGSSGSAIHAIWRLIPRLSSGTRVVTLFPDRGERYLGVIYGDRPNGKGDIRRARGVD